MPEDRLTAVEVLIRGHPDGIAIRDVMRQLDASVSRRTLQHWLRQLVDAGRIAREGSGRGTTYRSRILELEVHAQTGPPSAHVRIHALPEDLARQHHELKRRYLSLPPDHRRRAGYRREFLDAYRPNATAYLSTAERARLRAMGQLESPPEPAGTHARRILGRMLIDLSWNSSRLEGNTYSLLETQRLLESGLQADGRDARETQMILNHKHVIEFLVDRVEDGAGLDRATILNLHGILADNLLPDPAASGRLRSRPVGIGRSAYRPLDVPQLLEECFDGLLSKAYAIDDPFEQALFCLIQLPYLQAFEDVNKRVSRLAANVPFIRHNLSPLAFVDVPRDCYTDALLLVYERNDIGLMKALFLWAYERSAARYGAVRQAIGQPDPFRLLYREELREVVARTVRERLDSRTAVAHIRTWAAANIEPADRHRFQEVAETELMSLHEGNYARYGVTPREFEGWRAVWEVAS